MGREGGGVEFRSKADGCDHTVPSVHCTTTGSITRIIMGLGIRTLRNILRKNFQFFFLEKNAFLHLNKRNHVDFFWQKKTNYCCEGQKNAQC